MQPKFPAFFSAIAIATTLLMGSIAGLKPVSLAYGEAAADTVGVLPSWNDGLAKRAIIDFVQRVTTEGGPDFVPQEERIATFDNDGTLWVEQPLYTEFLFAIAQGKAAAARDPTLAAQEPYKKLMSDDPNVLSQLDKSDIEKLMAISHSGMTPGAFKASAAAWLAAAAHPRFNRLATELAYQPMLELLDYLRASGFKTFIVSGGGVDFIRAYSDMTYGVPSEQVIGTSGKTKFQLNGDKAELLKLPEVNSDDDAEGKPININLQIGRRPIFAFGNSDGDLEMLQYTASNGRPSLMLLLHHDDADREYAYDRNSKIGHLDKAWVEAVQRGWIIVSMKDDFKAVFSFEE